MENVNPIYGIIIAVLVLANTLINHGCESDQRQRTLELERQNALRADSISRLVQEGLQKDSLLEQRGQEIETLSNRLEHAEEGFEELEILLEQTQEDFLLIKPVLDRYQRKIVPEARPSLPHVPDKSS